MAGCLRHVFDRHEFHSGFFPFSSRVLFICVEHKICFQIDFHFSAINIERKNFSLSSLFFFCSVWVHLAPNIEKHKVQFSSSSHVTCWWNCCIYNNSIRPEHCELLMRAIHLQTSSCWSHEFIDRINSTWKLDAKRSEDVPSIEFIWIEKCSNNSKSSSSSEQ